MAARQQNLFSLEGKVAIVTGGTGVLGSAMVRGLAGAGADVIVLGRRKDVAKALAEGIRQAGVRSQGVSADVLNRAQLEDVRDRVLREFGSIDILVNAAGGNIPGAVVPPDRTFFNLDLAEVEKVFDLNLMGTILPCQVFAEAMTGRSKGSIVNITSMASIRPLTRVVGYSAAKAAVHNFTQWLATEMAKKFGEGIRVNAIAPGYFITEQNRSLLTHPDGSFTERGQAAINHTPFRRFGQPEELTGTLIWLCSDASAFVTGIEVPVDGGFSAFGGV
jgi:NAD(P)-dependent dehydrogenase (short-subunit alcohol dehydrogenase family)